MKKLVATGITCILILIQLSVFSTATSNKVDDLDSEDMDENKWTFMFYEALDANLQLPERWDFVNLSGVRSGENLNIIVFEDTYSGPGKIWSIDKAGRRTLLEHLGEVNTGSYETLRDFILYCKKQFPAQRYIIDFFSDGAAWQGTCMDLTDTFDLLTIEEIRRALSEAGGVDIISFIVPCKMASVEIVYEFRDCADVVIGKESNAYGSTHVAGPLCNILDNEYYLSTIDFGRKAIEVFKEKAEVFPWSLWSGKCLSAMRTDKVVELVQALDNLSVMLLDNIGDYYDTLKSVVAETESFPTRNRWVPEWYKDSGSPEKYQIDIYDFAYNFCKICGSNTRLYHCLQDVMEAVNKTVIAEHHTADHPDAHGLHIYFPVVYIQNVPFYDYSNYQLDFVSDTSWDEFLIAYDSFNCRVDQDGNGEYTSIQEAIDHSINGDVIYVTKGVYHESIVINKSITLVGDGWNFRPDTIVDGDKTGDVVTITADGAMLLFFGIRNSSDDEAGVHIYGNHTIIRSCTVYNNTFGVYLNDSFDNKIFRWNQFYDNTYGIYLYNASNNKICKSNRIYNNSYGIYLSSSNGNYVYSNRFVNNSRHTSFSDSYRNTWDNTYLDHPERLINLIIGTRSIGPVVIPWINLDRRHLVPVEIALQLFETIEDVYLPRPDTR